MKKVLFLFGQIGDDDVEWMMSVGEKQTVPAGHVLIHEGRPIDAIYIVLDGTLVVSVASLGNREINRIGCGEIVGEMSFIDERAPSATVTAYDNSTVFVIPTAALSSKLKADTAFAARFYRALTLFLSDRLRSSVALFGYDSGSMDEEIQYDDELNPSVLDNVHVAGSRFDSMLKRLMGS